MQTSGMMGAGQVAPDTPPGQQDCRVPAAWPISPGKKGPGDRDTLGRRHGLPSPRRTPEEPAEGGRLFPRPPPAPAPAPPTLPAPGQ